MDAELNFGLCKESDLHLLGNEALVTSEQDIELGLLFKRMGNRMAWSEAALEMPALSRRGQSLEVWCTVAERKEVKSHNCQMVKSSSDKARLPFFLKLYCVVLKGFFKVCHQNNVCGGYPSKLTENS